MLERENHELKSENRALKRSLDSSAKQSSRREAEGHSGGMSSSHRTCNDGGELEAKRELLKRILKTNKLLEKYVAAKKNSRDDPDFRIKLREKLPQFEAAIRKLERMKESCRFVSAPGSEHNSSLDNNFTMLMNSTIHTSANTRLELKNDSKGGNCSESFNKSVKSLLNSMKTDNLSKMSDQAYLRELKQNSLAENERVFEEKLCNLGALLAQLRE